MKYRREIDGLRALAVVPVVLFHAGFSLFSGGYVGVDVFFVISGYLITTILLAELHAEKFSIVKFYERRARRLLPALFLVMACCLPFAWLWLLPEDMVDFGQSLMAVVGFVSNLLFWREETGYFNTAAELKPLLHTWSLAVEEQFYLLFPLLLMLLWKLPRTGLLVLLAFVSAISLAIAQWGAHNQPAAAWFLLPTRAWELGIGALVAMHLHNKPLDAQARGGFNQLMSLVGIGMIAWAIFFFDDNTPFPGVWGLLPVVGTALVILFATPATLGGKLLGARSMVGVGLISYSAYLWHQPLLAFARQRNIVELELPVVWSLIVATFVLAWLSWRYVETPFRHASTVSRKQVFSFSAAGMMAFFAVGTTSWATNGFDGRVQGELAEGLLAVSREKTGQQDCWEAYIKQPFIENACSIGLKKEKADFALVGDSSAGALFSQLEAFSMRRTLGGVDMTLFACPVLLASERKDHSQRTACRRFGNEFREAAVAGRLPPTLIVSSRWTLWLERQGVDNQEGGKESIRNITVANENTKKLGYVEALSRDYAESIQMLLANGYKVVLIYPVPEMGWDVPKHLMKTIHINGELTLHDASISHQVFRQRNARAYAALNAVGDHENLVRIYPEKLFCNSFIDGRCAAHVDGKPLYSDDDHLSKYGAELVLERVIEHL
ncbi:acyltransferase family protein [Marinobacter sp. chi1]|uniref:Acyltransferase family protein n=1 Tax=Marinobacter suaedae TaxID=3057675 RepID=A0ABT8VWG3_9GAMM|nr:acyltransferase family protein [Marinobacter sp. chi1]MDO3720318.1 acyltransferase family protein [Marinobacter sp. chi1]